MTDARTDRPALRPDRVEALRRQLNELPARLECVRGMRTAKAAPGESRRGRPGSKPPLNLTIAHLTDLRHKSGWDGALPSAEHVVDRFGVVPALESWTRLVREEMLDASLDVPDMAETPTAASECRWLLDVLPFALTRDWVIELADDVRSIHAQLGAILGERPEYRPRCRVIGCGWRLDPMDNGTWYACRGCGRQYVIDADLRALGQTQPPISGREAARALGIPWATVRSWANRGLLIHEGRDRKGRKLYDLDTLRRLALRAEVS